jgi:hypothetical protein
MYLGPGVDLSRVLPIEILVKVIELLSPPTCLILAEVNKFFSQSKSNVISMLI